MTSSSPHVNTTGTTQYVVAHCEPCETEGTCPAICLIALEPNEAVVTGQPYVQIFDDYDEALEIATSLGYQELTPGGVLPPPVLPEPPAIPEPPEPPAPSAPDLTPPPIVLPPVPQPLPSFPVGE
jgi:hypothetical protein